MADKFEGFDVQIRDRVSELDRSNEASGIIQGTIIRWEMVNGRFGESIAKTAFVGEDEEGRLVFSGIDVTNFCFIPTGLLSRTLIPRVMNQGCVRGSIILGSDEFGPEIKYKIAVNVRARVVAPIIYPTRRDCSSRPEFSTPCSIHIGTNSIHLLTILSPTIPNHSDSSSNSVADINLTAETDAIEFNSKFPGGWLTVELLLVGKQISIDKVVLSKKVFHSS